MQVNIQPNGQEVTVQLIGELDTMATTEQADELQQVLNIADKALLIDCSEMEYISSAGLRFFMQLVCLFGSSHRV
jgi:anti-anti-sigma factor